MPELTEKQRKFVEAYMGQANGNATEAARLAGYSGSYRTLQNVGSTNLSKPIICEAIEKRQNGHPLVADRQERQEFWTEMMRDINADPKDRLRASEILGKSSGDFIERIQSDTNLKIIVEYENHAGSADKVTDAA